MTDTYKETIRRAAKAVCRLLGSEPFVYVHVDEVQRILVENITHPHSPYECYWRDRALTAEKALEEVLRDADCEQQPLESQ